MRKSLLVIVAVALSATGAFAEQLRLPKSDPSTATGKASPPKRAMSGNSCAEFGAGFVRLEGTNTCVKVGGAISVGAGASTGSR